MNLTPDEVEGCQHHHFRVDITPYFASLIDPDDPNCPIRRQVIPTSQELVDHHGLYVDSLNEDAHSPVPGLVHRYPDRVLMLVTTQCASYCRYCTRSRIGAPRGRSSAGATTMPRSITSRGTPQVRDVLLSGGDPLILPQKILENLPAALAGHPSRGDRPHREQGTGLSASAHYARTGGHAEALPPALDEYPFQSRQGDHARGVGGAGPPRRCGYPVGRASRPAGGHQ